MEVTQHDGNGGITSTGNIEVRFRNDSSSELGKTFVT